MAVAKLRCRPLTNLKSSPFVITGGSYGGSYSFDSIYSYNDLAQKTTDGILFLFYVEGNAMYTASDSITAGDVAGYQFDGWYTTPGDIDNIYGVTSSSFSSLLTSSKTLPKSTIVSSAKVLHYSVAGTQEDQYLICAKYSPLPSYTITYRPGTYGIGSVQTQDKDHGANVSLKGAIFTRTGYTQTGWATTDGGTQAYALQGNYSENADVTLYPVWTANTYTVTFVNWNGTTLKTQNVNHGSGATAPSNPNRNGYTFAGWDKAFTNVTSNLTVTATFTPNTYTVTLNANGGTIVSGNVTQYTVGTGATLPTNVTKTGHTFAGWYANEDLSGNPVSAIGTSEYGNKTYWAKWTVNTYAVTLRTNGGTINRGNVTSYTFGNGATLPTDVTRTGFSFGGWFAASDFSGDRIYDIAPDATGDKTFYAKWTSEFTVTFEDYDGTVLKTVTVPSGGDATPPDDPVREGYDFDRWDGDYTNVTSDRTITATYAVKQLTVTFKDFDGTTIGTPQTVNWGSAAAAPTPPTHTGYTFTGWSRDFSNVTENIEVVAIYSGAANYTIRGRRWQRLYTAAKATPVYAAESEASLAARTICDVPWTETSGNFVSCLTAHPGTAETDEHNLANREYFDAAAFCAGHENGMHRVHAQATCYRFALPASAEDKRMNTLKLVVSGDPYLRDGARIAVLTNDTGVIPTDCSTCRTGDVHAEGVAKRTVSADGSRWYGKTDTLQFTPTGGLTLGKYLFVFVILENYAYSRGEYVEGSACIQPNVEIGMATTVGEWTPNVVNLCYEDLSHAYNVCRDGILPEVTGEVSGVQTIMLQRTGDPTTGTLHTSVTDAQSCIGLRSVYAALYERRLSAVAKSVALSANAREGAGFVVRGDQESVGGTNVKTWQLTTAALLVPFAVPVEFRADKVRLDWANWSGGATSGGRFNVWLKRGAFVTDYPAEDLKNPALYDATVKNVEGYELLGTIDATQTQKNATFVLEDPLGGYVATILLTAFISLDALNPSSGMTLPQGVATSIDVNPSGSSMSGKGSGWKPDITLLG